MGPRATKSPRPAPPPSFSRTGRRTVILGALAILVATFAAYLPAIQGGYIWDDDLYVYDNPLLPAPDGLYRIWLTKDSPSQYFPLTFTSLRLEYALWGANPLGYHLNNVVLHIVNACLVWLILGRLGIPLAWLAGALFALHPVQVESVAWITERKNVLSTLFYLLSVWFWMDFDPAAFSKRKKPYFLALLFHALALFAKTTACTLPAVLVLVRWMRRQMVGRREIPFILPFVLMGLGMGLVTIWWENSVQGTGQLAYGLSLLERTLLASRALWFYLGKLLWPSPIVFSYPQWTITAADPRAYVWPAGILLCAVLLWRRWNAGQRGPAIAGLFFVAVLSPMLGFIPLFTFRYTYVADHYQYLACAAPIALVCAALGHRRVPRKIRPFTTRIIPLSVLTVLAVLTWRQSHAYADEEACWRDTIRKNPASWMAHNNLGNILLQKEKVDDALVHYREAVRINPSFADAHNNVGVIHSRQGRSSEAIVSFTHAVNLRGDYAEAHTNLGIELARQGSVEEAVECFRTALRWDPSYPPAKRNLEVGLGDLRSRAAAAANPCAGLEKTGNPAAADSCYSRRVRENPDSVRGYLDRGYFLAMRGRTAEALADFSSAILLRPSDIQAYLNRGTALAMTGDYHGSIEDFSRALSLDSTADRAWFNRGISRMHLGDTAGACVDWRRASGLGSRAAARQMETTCNRQTVR